MEDIVEEFNKLTQTGTVDELLARFEDLKAQMIMSNPTLNESHFLSSFMGALREEIKFAVKMFKPATLSVAIEQARLQEKAIEAVQKKTRTVNKGPVISSVPSLARPISLPTNKSTPLRLSTEVYEYRKTNKLCFKCGEKFAAVTNVSISNLIVLLVQMRLLLKCLKNYLILLM